MPATTELSICDNKKTQLVLNNGFAETHEQDFKLWFDDNTSFTVFSRISALLAIRFKLSAAGNLKVILGERCLMECSKTVEEEKVLYFVVSQGENKIFFEYSGPKYFAIFEADTELNGIFNFAIINPKMEILAQ